MHRTLARMTCTTAMSVTNTGITTPAAHHLPHQSIRQLRLQTHTLTSIATANTTTGDNMKAWDTPNMA
eukprot:1158186-Pelagomonas_calceolata.AAC.5